MSQAAGDNSGDSKRPTPPQRVGVGIGAVLLDPETKKILLGLRKGSHGENTWALPGGWLEVGESFEECALREIEEETGLKCGIDVDVVSSEVLDIAPSNNIMLPKVHSASVFVRVTWKNRAKQPRVMEPDKCERWEWFDTVGNDVKWPENLFPSARYLLVDKAHLLKAALHE